MKNNEYDFIKATISSVQELDYITIIFSNKVCVYRNSDLLFEHNAIEISGAVYINDLLLYTVKEDNTLYTNIAKTKFVLSKYGSVKILKCISNTNYWVVLELDDKSLVAYDLWAEEILFELPIQHNFLDMSIRENNIGMIIGEDIIDLYEDDQEYIKLKTFHFDVQNRNVEVIDSLKIYNCYDNWDDKYTSSVSSKHNMKIPLLNMYLYYFPQEMSISANGNYIVYYSDDIKGIIISDFQNGNVFRLFVLPVERTATTQYYFNENTNIFTIINGEYIERYIIEQTSDNLIGTLNKYYNDALINRKHLREDIEFKNLFYQVLMGGKCMIAKDSEFKYDIALSFAGENRAYVEKIAQSLTDEGINVFYDKFETANLWGKDLYQYLSDIYKNKAKYCVIFVSEQYKEKVWTRHELKNAQNRAFLDNREYILPIFIDDVKLDGLNDTIGYVRASEFTQHEIVNLIISKLGKPTNPFVNCLTIKQMLDMAIKKIYHASKTDYNQIILNSTINSHSLGLVVVADIISKDKQKYRLVSVSGVITAAYGEQRTINISDVSKEKKYMCAVEKTCSELVVPIKVKENVIGVINIESEKKNYFSSELVNRIEQLSIHIGYMLNLFEFNLQNFEKLPYISYNPNEII